MKSALIGNTGFVGSNLASQHSFDKFYNSKNIEDISKDTFELIVCAGAPGSKWLANKQPDEDKQSIYRLIECLQKTETSKLVLISTIDIYTSVDGVDENTTVVVDESNCYGKNRRELEIFAEENFDSCIIRLPGVFGAGLKKNPIFDLSQNKLDFIHPDAIMQYYYLAHLWDDIELAIKNELELLNIAVEPIALKEIASTVFDIKLNSSDRGPAPYYDMQTNFSELWGQPGRYLYYKQNILTDLKVFADQS